MKENKKQFLIAPRMLRIKNGEVVMSDGSSSKTYLDEFAKESNVTDEMPVALIRSDILDELYENENAKDFLRCSFCDVWQTQTERLIAGANVYICAECVDICNDIIKEHKLSKTDDAQGSKDESAITARK